MDHEPNAVWTKDTSALEEQELALIARSMIAARKAIHGPLPTDLIHDPVLDIVLNLFVAKTQRSTLTLSALCKSTTVASSSCIRWIAALLQRDLLVQYENGVRLSDRGLAAMTDMLRAVAISQWQFSD